MVARLLAKEKVAGSNPVFRSILTLNQPPATARTHRVSDRFALKGKRRAQSGDVAKR